MTYNTITVDTPTTWMSIIVIGVIFLLSGLIILWALLKKPESYDIDSEVFR
ncbi:MAG: hypothetical protein ACTSWQ_05020 [Candidatus Thorarchaeota archaeon]